MIVYEYPFNESMRTMLRLEHLLQRAATLAGRETPLDHHFALVTLFEIMDVASRADIKSDLLQELDRQRRHLRVYRGNPAISEAALEAALEGIERAWQSLNALPGKAGQGLAANDWLMAIRSRIGIPGGTCSFDLPGYHAWQHRPAARRQADLQHWTATLLPLSQALETALRVLRESGQSQRALAQAGRFQQTLGAGRSVQLARVRVPEGTPWFAEISGNRLLVAIRLMTSDPERGVEPVTSDQIFDLVLCA